MSAHTEGSQRWRLRRQYAATPDKFEPGRHEVVTIGHGAARSFVVEHHYLRAWPAAQRCFGLLRDGVLAGACVFGVPVQPKVLTGPFPDLAPYRESCELLRLVLLDDVERNGESWFVARCFKELRSAGVRGVVAHSDPQVIEGADGTLIKRGHVGIVYQALNAEYMGVTAPRTRTVLSDGTVFSDRARQKVRRRERGWRYAAAQLERLGADPAPSLGPLDLWLPAALDAAGARQVRTCGLHRYRFALGARPAPPTGRYPKPALSLLDTAGAR